MSQFEPIPATHEPEDKAGSEPETNEALSHFEQAESYVQKSRGSSRPLILWLALLLFMALVCLPAALAAYGVPVEDIVDKYLGEAFGSSQPSPQPEQKAEVEPVQKQPQQKPKIKPSQLNPKSSLFGHVSKEAPQVLEPAEQYTSPELVKLLKDGRYFDIHYFVEDGHVSQLPRLILEQKEPWLTGKAKQDDRRQLINISRSEQQMETLMYQMRNPSTRPAHMPSHFSHLKAQKKELTDMTFFAYELALQPDNKDYLEAEFYYYDKKYEMGKYGKQLPICLALVGKNNANVILKMYESIHRQNYTNYRIAHMDDNSDDDTLEKVMAFLEERPELRDRTTIVAQNYERNALYNRHFANTKVCQKGDIILDLDTDDFLVGSQVFQLVNTLYQRGYQYQGRTEEVWSIFLNFIEYAQGCCPISKLFGPIEARILDENVYRNSFRWRTNHLRTYLYDLYTKIDPTDYIDPENVKQGEFYGQAPDLFMMASVLELSAPKHMMVVDEFVYFYKRAGTSQRDPTYPEYCSAAGRTNPFYQPLKSLADQPVRKPTKANMKARAHTEKMKKQVKEKLNRLKQNVLAAFQRARGQKN